METTVVAENMSEPCVLPAPNHPHYVFCFIDMYQHLFIGHWSLSPQRQSYGAIQICLLLLFIIITVLEVSLKAQNTLDCKYKVWRTLAVLKIF